MLGLSNNNHLKGASSNNSPVQQENNICEKTRTLMNIKNIVGLV